MKNEFKIRIPSRVCGTAVVVAALGFLCGCGGGGGNNGGGTPSSGRSATTGTVTMQLAWPTTSNSSTLPAQTTDFVLKVILAQGTFASTGTNTASVDMPYGAASVTVPNVPAGTCNVVANAVEKNSDGTHGILMSGSNSYFTVLPNQDNPVAVVLGAVPLTYPASFTTTIRKVIDSDGTRVTNGTPQPLTGVNVYSNLQNGAVYEIVASFGSSSSDFNAFIFAPQLFSQIPIVNFVDSDGNALSIRVAYGDRCYFKANLTGQEINEQEGLEIIPTVEAQEGNRPSLIVDFEDPTAPGPPIPPSN